MGQPVDLGNFKPESVKDLFDALVSHILPVLGKEAKQGAKDLETHIQALANAGYATVQDLAAGKIDKQQAEFLMDMQEAYLKNILRLAAFLPFVAAQAVLDAAKNVLKAAFKGWTGISLDF